MEPEIKDSDVVIVRKQETAETGDIVIALVNGDAGTCKRLVKYATGIRLMPVNPRYEPIYIFDDTFSALDYKTDRELRKALKTEMKDATCLIVAQRIGTIMDADLILVLDNGRVVGQGTHRELLKNCQTYREIAQSQLSEEEIKNA